MKIGYARVSTTDQHLENQIKLLREADCEDIFEEKISGARKDRPELEKLLRYLRQGDTLVVCKLDRIAHSTAHLLEIIETLRSHGVAFCSLGEPWADTTTHEGEIFLTVLAGIAEFDRNVIRERTSRRRKTTRARGGKFGRPHKLSSEQQQLALNLIEEGTSVQKVANTFKVDRSTIYRLTKSREVKTL